MPAAELEADLGEMRYLLHPKALMERNTPSVGQGDDGYDSVVAGLLQEREHGPIERRADTPPRMAGGDVRRALDGEAIGVSFTPLRRVGDLPWIFQTI